MPSRMHSRPNSNRCCVSPLRRVDAFVKYAQYACEPAGTSSRSFHAACGTMSAGRGLPGLGVLGSLFPQLVQDRPGDVGVDRREDLESRSSIDIEVVYHGE